VGTKDLGWLVGIRVGVAKIVVVTGLGGIVGVTGFCGLWALKWAWQIGRHRFSRFVNVKMGVANFLLKWA